MKHHTDAERALIDTFRAAGGERVIFFRRGQPQLAPAEVEALARLVRSGRIRRHATGDFGWVSYRLREWAGGEASVEPADGVPGTTLSEQSPSV